MIPAFAALLVLQLVGEALVQAFGLPLPGPLLGLLLLLAALLALGRVPEGLRTTAGTLLANLMLLFIPAVTGVMLHFGRIAQEWVAFVLACVAGTAVTMAVTALTLRWMLNREGRR